MVLVLRQKVQYSVVKKNNTPFCFGFVVGFFYDGCDVTTTKTICGLFDLGGRCLDLRQWRHTVLVRIITTVIVAIVHVACLEGEADEYDVCIQDSIRFHSEWIEDAGCHVSSKPASRKRLAD